jgi:DNA anti-recombination protein RmuC
MLLVSSAQLPALSQISWFAAQKPRLSQKQQHKQQQQQQQQTKQQTIAKPFQNLSGLGFDWLQF